MADKSVFETLNAINVNDKTEKKDKLTYLSWAWAWTEVKKCYPNANYKIYENDNGFNYFTDGRTCWVKTSVTIEGLEHIETLPIMDFRNKSIPLASVTSFEVNKSIQRCLTKACARHGLGLYIYAGEDLPEDEDTKPQAKSKSTKTAPKTAPQVKTSQYICESCGKPLQALKTDKRIVPVEELAGKSLQSTGKVICVPCLTSKRQG